MQKLEQLYEGKAKQVFKTDQPGLFWVQYKDDATAFDGLKKGTINNKGTLNNLISIHFFKMLEQHGITNHFVEAINDREMIVRAVKIILVEVVVRNIAAGSLAKRLGMEEGTPLRHTIVEYYYKSDELHDPMINDDHISVMELATPEQMSYIRDIALKVNEIMRTYLAERGLDLIDFKLEFGIDNDGKVILADEISPDTCRFWDSQTKEKLDKDRFRRDLGNVEEAYQEVYRRLTN